MPAARPAMDVKTCGRQALSQVVWSVVLAVGTTRSRMRPIRFRRLESQPFEVAFVRPVDTLAAGRVRSVVTSFQSSGA